MASFFVRNNTSGSSFKSISGAMSRKEASDFNWLSNQFDDRCCRSAKTCVALEWKLLCFYYMCQFFVVLYNTRKFYLKILLRYGQRQFGKKKNNEKAAIKSQKRASQTGNCGSVLVRNVNEGTLELKKKTLEIISPSNTASCLLQWLYGELCGCWEQIFVAPNKVVFSASYSKSGLVNKLKLFSRMCTTRAKISLRNQGTLLV